MIAAYATRAEDFGLSTLDVNRQNFVSLQILDNRRLRLVVSSPRLLVFNLQSTVERQGNIVRQPSLLHPIKQLSRTRTPDAASDWQQPVLSLFRCLTTKATTSTLSDCLFSSQPL
jgi:hypothetical protein